MVESLALRRKCRGSDRTVKPSRGAGFYRSGGVSDKKKSHDRGGVVAAHREPHTLTVPILSLSLRPTYTPFRV